MKRLFKLSIALLLSIPVMSQGYETIEKNTLQLNQPGRDGKLTVLNINGPVSITGTDRDDVLVKYELEVKPKSKRGLEIAKEELRFEVKELGDSLVIALDAPFVNDYRGERHININSEHMEYWFRCNIEIEVPQRINLRAETINDGDVTIDNITGTIAAENINGDVALKSVNGQVISETINGDITIDFEQNPGDGSHFQTINGTIRTRMPENLSASVAFKSMNGEFFTDFDYRMDEAGRVVTDYDHHSGTRYKIEQQTRVKIGSGQASMSYETLNGNMYLRKLN